MPRALHRTRFLSLGPGLGTRVDFSVLFVTSLETSIYSDVLRNRKSATSSAHGEEQFLELLHYDFSINHADRELTAICKDPLLKFYFQLKWQISFQLASQHQNSCYEK